MRDVPNPGSDEARAAGCICAVLDNNHGLIAPWPPDGWWITGGCPVHMPGDPAAFPPHNPDFPDVNPATGDERETTEGRATTRRPVAEIVKDLRVVDGSPTVGALRREAADELERLDGIVQHFTVAVCVVCGQSGATWTGREYRHPGCGDAA